MRHDLKFFVQVYSSKTSNKYFSNKFNNFKSYFISPCCRSIEQKATITHCILLPPKECGWVVDDNLWEQLWYKGRPTALPVEDVFLDDDEISDRN